ncbi:MAG: hypothetical protein COA80_10120 [Leeuwenhoekiella sp.]|nr:MAG: hypothetical protein COA80_10120 [Leeuwenhoekiella sp.]
MKQILVVLSFLAFTACDKVDELTKFDLDYTSRVTIESGTLIDLPFVVRTPPMQTNSETEFESNNTRKDLIESIKLTQMTLTITSPSNEDFTFLESIEVFIKADGLDEIPLAALDPVAGNASGRINLETSNAELREYIKKDSFTLRVESVTDEALDRDIDIDILSVFRVDAKILGI